MSRMSRSEANKSTLSRDSTRQMNDNDNSDDNLNISNRDDNDDSPTNLSQHSDDVVTEDIQNLTNNSGLVYAAATGGHGDDQVVIKTEQPEVHIVRIRDLEDDAVVQHPQQADWPQTESEI